MRILRAATVGLGILGGLFGIVAFLDLLVSNSGAATWAALIAVAVGTAGVGMALGAPKRGGTIMLAAALVLTGLSLATGEHGLEEVIYSLPFAAGGLLALLAVRPPATGSGPMRAGRGMRTGGALLATVGGALALIPAAMALVLFFFFPDVALASLVVLPLAIVGLIAAGRAGSAPASAGRAMLWVGGIQAAAAGVLTLAATTGFALLPNTAYLGLGFIPGAVLFLAGGLVTRRGARPGAASGAEPVPEPVPVA